MSLHLNPSSEFAALVRKLKNAPDDPVLKQDLIRRLPGMKALARRNPLALYRLAKVYPKNSGQYYQMMVQSADAGCTNAMLALCKLLVKSASSTDKLVVVNYLNKIFSSNDSYIIQRAEAFLEMHPDLRNACQPELN